MVDQEPWGSLTAPDKSIYGEVYDEISRKTGLPFSISISSLARSLEDVRSGYCKFVIASWQPSRGKNIVKRADLATLGYGVLPRKGLLITDVTSLKQLRIATARGLLIGEPFDHDPDIRKIGVHSYGEGVLMTEAGRADGVVGSIISLLRLARLHGTMDKFGDPLILADVSLALQMNPGFAQTSSAEQIDEAVSWLRDSGQAQAIISRHMQDN